MLRKQINKIIEIEGQIDKVYEKISNAEYYKDEITLKENLSHLRFLKEVEDEYVQELNIDKDKFYKLARLLNSDNYLKLFQGSTDGIPLYRVDTDDLNNVYDFLFYDINECKKEVEFNLDAIFCKTINHPIMRRLFYKLIDSYYRNIENPSLNFDSMVIQILLELIRQGQAHDHIFAIENRVALLYLDACVESEMKFLTNAFQSEYQKKDDVRDFFIEMKRYLSFSNPNLESYLLVTDSFYQNPSTFKLQSKYQKGNLRFYKKIREYICQFDLECTIAFIMQKGNLYVSPHDIFYKLYIKSKLAFLSAKKIDTYNRNICHHVEKENYTKALFESFEEEREERAEKRKRKMQ